MFDSSKSPRKHIGTRLADAADLLIDFATLGEYGFEPVAKAAPTCETRHRRPLPAPAARPRRLGAPTLVLATEKQQSRRRHQIDGPFLLRP